MKTPGPEGALLCRKSAEPDNQHGQDALAEREALSKIERASRADLCCPAPEWILAAASPVDERKKKKKGYLAGNAKCLQMSIGAAVGRRSLSQSERDEALRRLRRGGDIRTVAEAVGAPPGAVKGIKHNAVGRRGNATTDGKPVSARLTPGEIEQLEWLKSRFGFGSNSDAIRALVRSASGMLEFDPVTAEKLTDVKAELHKIGVNVNQIALAANRGRLDLARQEWSALNAVREALPGLRIYLQAVVDEQRRRGTRLFQKFIEAERG